MNAEQFYQQMVETMARPPQERHARMAHLHTEIVEEYVAALRAITPEQAAQAVSVRDDSRTLIQVVGHIAAWERFTILAAGDILAGVEHPRMVTTLDGYIEPDGQAPAFNSIDAFNDYQARKFASWSWPQVQALAIDTALTLHILFTHPHLLTAGRLEQTKPFRKRIPGGAIIRDITMGWFLWLTTLEHEGVEHALELAMSH